MNNTDYSALQFNKAINQLLNYLIISTNMSDSEIMRYPDLMTRWSNGIQLNSGDIIRYGVDENGRTKIYRSKRDHIAQQNIPPGEEFSNDVYELIGYVNNIRIWSEPLGIMDSYQIDDIAHYNGKIYKCTIENNRFSPDQFGWVIV